MKEVVSCNNFWDLLAQMRWRWLECWSMESGPAPVMTPNGYVHWVAVFVK
mgnify:CR=1 FL=1